LSKAHQDFALNFKTMDLRKCSMQISVPLCPRPLSSCLLELEDLYGASVGQVEGHPDSVSAAAAALPSRGTASLSSVSASGGPAVDLSPVKSEDNQSLCCCIWIKNVDPRVLDLIYWRDVKKTGAVFGSVLLLLVSLALFSVLSVLAYLSLVLLTITITYRLYKNVLAAVQKSGDGHPFQQYLDMNISLSDERIHRAVEQLMKCVALCAAELRRLFLVEDIVDSLKFGLLLWLLTYVGAWFNGMTLIILSLITLFTLPKIYDTYKVQIDQTVEKAKCKLHLVYKQIQEKLPLPGKKKQA